MDDNKVLNTLMDYVHTAFTMSGWKLPKSRTRVNPLP
jgi:hypothetical protein